MRHLIDKFKEAGLTLKILDRPMGRGAGQDQIVQIDIGRKMGGKMVRTEWFEIYPGKGNNIQVLNIDKSSRQLVLLVDEPVREFDIRQRVTSPSRRKKVYEENRQRGEKIRIEGDELVFTSKTSGNKRHFLMGVDERQLFIAQTKEGVSTVAQARRSLGSTVAFHEGKRRMTPGRQGEWFMLETTSSQRDYIDKLIRETKTVIQKNKNIGDVMGRPGGNPHIAAELVVVPRVEAAIGFTRRDGRLNLGSVPAQGRKVFVRGTIRHVDHKTIKYSHWREVIANNEGNTGTGTSSGIRWID